MVRLVTAFLLVVGSATSRWCAPDEFRDEDGIIRLELLPAHCEWLGLGGQHLTASNLRNFSRALAVHPNLVHLGLGGNAISDDGAIGTISHFIRVTEFVENVNFYVSRV